MFADRVKETTTTTGTDPVALGGAMAGYRTFASQFADGVPVSYVIVDPLTGAFEQGYGTLLAGSILIRNRVEESSNSDALVNFGAGTKQVFCAMSSKAALRVMSAVAAVTPFV